MFTTGDITNMIHIAEHNSPVTLVGALCIASLQKAVERQESLMRNPAQLSVVGLPSMEDIAEEVIVDVMGVMPPAIINNFRNNFDAGVLAQALEARDEMGSMGVLISALVRQIITERPDLVELTYRPS